MARTKAMALAAKYGKYRTKPRPEPGPGLPDNVMVGKENRKKIRSICDHNWRKKRRQFVNKQPWMKELRGEAYPTSKKYPHNYGACIPKKKKKGKGLQPAGTASTQHRVIEKQKPIKRKPHVRSS